jgi:hypothetical protein
MLCVFSVHKEVQSRRWKISCLLFALAFLFSGLPLSYTGVSGVQTRREGPGGGRHVLFLSVQRSCVGFFCAVLDALSSSFTCLSSLRISPFVISKIGYPPDRRFPMRLCLPSPHLTSSLLSVPPFSFPWFVQGQIFPNGWGACVVRSTQRLENG